MGEGRRRCWAAGVLRKAEAAERRHPLLLRYELVARLMGGLIIR